MKYDLKQIEYNILNNLYETKLESPQSLSKIRASIGLTDNRGDNRALKTCLQALIDKSFIKKQETRGNYKIEEKGIDYMDERKN